jgi:vacuolar protein sorting-associated protein 8
VPHTTAPMSSQSSRREDGLPEDMGQDEPHFSTDTNGDGDKDRDDVSSDEETIRGDVEGGHIAGVLEDEMHDDAINAPPIQVSVHNRYRDLLREQASGSDDGSSMDGLPRRAGSPIDSLLSGPEDSPSVQVRMSSYSSPVV